MGTGGINNTHVVLFDIEQERKRQLKLNIGGNTEEFDKTNTANDWIAYINAYIGRASRRVRRNNKECQEFRDNMIKAGALIVAAVEAYDAGYFNKDGTLHVYELGMNCEQGDRRQYE